MTTVIKKQDGKKTSVRYATPVGRFSYPYLTKTKDGGEYPSFTYETDLLVKKSDMNSPEGKALVLAILQEAAEIHGKKFKSVWDIPGHIPLKDMDVYDEGEREPSDHEKGCIRIRAKRPKGNPQKGTKPTPPSIVGPNKQELSAEQKEELKGGDYGRLSVTLWSWGKGAKKGVSMNLEAVQFWKSGEAFGVGKAASLSVFDEMEVPLEDFEEEQEEGIDSATVGGDDGEEDVSF